MLLFDEHPHYVDQLTERLKALAIKLSDYAPAGEEVRLEKTADLYKSVRADEIFMIKSGHLSAKNHDKLCFHYEAGDFIGLAESYHLPALTIMIDDPVTAMKYNAAEFLKKIHADETGRSIWTSYLLTLVSWYQDAFGRHQSERESPETGFLNFMAGQTMIEQGDDAHDVFTLLTGQASVLVDGTIVGDIHEDEIFGAMAVLTGDQRSATVIAKTDCAVLSVPRDQFKALIKSHPQTTMSLLENMAKNIKSLNEKLTETIS